MNIVSKLAVIVLSLFMLLWGVNSVAQSKFVATVKIYNLTGKPLSITGPTHWSRNVRVHPVTLGMIPTGAAQAYIIRYAILKTGIIMRARYHISEPGTIAKGSYCVLDFVIRLRNPGFVYEISSVTISNYQSALCVVSPVKSIVGQKHDELLVTVNKK